MGHQHLFDTHEGTALSEDDMATNRAGLLTYTRIDGAIVGMCWGGYHGEFGVGLDISRTAGRPRGGLRMVVQGLINSLGGNFVEPKLSPKSYITVAMVRVRASRARRWERSFDITAFPSIADLVAKEH